MAFVRQTNPQTPQAALQGHRRERSMIPRLSLKQTNRNKIYFFRRKRIRNRSAVSFPLKKGKELTFVSAYVAHRRGDEGQAELLLKNTRASERLCRSTPRSQTCSCLKSSVNFANARISAIACGLGAALVDAKAQSFAHSVPDSNKDNFGVRKVYKLDALFCSGPSPSTGESAAASTGSTKNKSERSHARKKTTTKPSGSSPASGPAGPARFFVGRGNGALTKPRFTPPSLLCIVHNSLPVNLGLWH